MFITTIHELDQLQSLKEAGADAIIVGIEGLSIRSSLNISLDQLHNVKQLCEQAHVLLYVNCLKLFMPQEMESLRQGLQICKEVGVDGIYFADEGVLFEAISLGIQDRLIYQPETLVTSSNDVSFYLDQGIQSVSLAHELSFDEIESMAQKQKNIEILIHGYFSILYSRRPLLTNYMDAIHQPKDMNRHRFELIEQTRDEKMPIWQDDTGTHIFSAHPIQSFAQFSSFQKLGLQRFRIDSIFKDDAWTCSILKAYRGQEPISDQEDGSDIWYHQSTIKAKEAGR